MSTPRDDYLAVKAALEADVRAACGFTESDRVYQVPIEIPDSKRDQQRCAAIYLDQAIESAPETAGASGLDKQIWRLAVDVWVRREHSGEPREDVCADLAFRLRNQIQSASNHPYANVASGHYVVMLDWAVGDPQSQWFQVRVVTEFHVYLDRSITWS